MKNKNVKCILLMLAALVSAIRAEVAIRTQVEPTGGPYTSVSSDNRIESQNVNTNYRGNQSLKMRNANGSRVIIPFMRFNISPLAGLDLSGATLSHTITWESVNCTPTLDVWGLIDGANDYWDAGTLTWTTATGTLGWLSTAAGTYSDFSVNTGVWQLLGTVTFTVTAGSPNLTVTTNTTNCNLDAFLSADTNGLVTLALMSNVNTHWCNIASADNVAGGTIPANYAPTLTFPIAVSNPQPADGSVILNYTSLTQLSWDNAQIARYDVWFGAADANEFDYQSALTKIATIDDPASSVVVNIPAGMLPLTAPQTYTWALDGYVYPASDPNHAGDPNQLLTTNLFQFVATALPTVNTAPADQYVFPAATASFTAVFDALVPVTAATWYKNGTPVSTSDPDVSVQITNGSGNLYTVTLTVSNVETADEAAYHCVASNSAGASAPTASAYLVVKRMLAHWGFNGNAAEDTGVYNGTLVGEPIFVTDGSRQGMEFDGVDDYIDLPDGFSNFRSGLTFLVWAKPVAVNNFARFVDFGNGEAIENIMFYRDGTTSNLRLNTTNGSVAATGAITQDEWQLLAVTMTEAGAVTFYKNGLPIATGTVGLPAAVTRTSNLIGKSNWASDALYKGLLDDVSVYNYAVTADEIATAYANIAGPFCRTPQAYDFDANCVVDLGDLMLVAADWLECGYWPSACPPLP